MVNWRGTDNLALDTQLELLKLPPHSIEAEQAVIGGLLIDNAAWERCGDAISEHDFYRHDHRVIFRHIVNLIEANKPGDIITVSESLELNSELTGVGGLAYLGTLAKNSPSVANIRRYAEIVRERAIMRKLATVCREIADLTYNPGGRDVKQILDEAESKVFEIAEQNDRIGDGLVPFSKIITEVIEEVDQLYHADSANGLAGTPTGFADLDKLTSGLEPGNLIIIAGRPSMGKTAFATNIAEYVASTEGLPVAFFSMEMGNTQIGRRILGSGGGLDQQRLKSGKLHDQDWPKLTHAVTKLSNIPLHIDETPALTVLDVRARTRRLQRQYGKLGLVVIDYLQLMCSPLSRENGENRATEISDICRSLKALSKELSVPLIALSQLNRGLESRNDKRPMLSDLRESGAIEQDADLILFVYRDEFYDKDSKDKGTAEIIIGKARNGPVGMVRLTFKGELMQFKNHTSGDYAY